MAGIERIQFRHIEARTDRLAKRTDPAQEPGLAIIDPQHDVRDTLVRVFRRFLDELERDADRDLRTEANNYGKQLFAAYKGSCS